MSLFTESSLCLVPSGVKDGKVYSIKPTDGSGDLTFSRGSDIEATRVASNGYIQKAKVNLILQSNSFNTTWTNTSTTETGGQSGYDGSSDAWLLSKSAAGGDINQTGLSVSGLQTFSLYAKAGTSTWISMTILGGLNPRTSFDLVNGVVGTLLGSAVSAKIESVGNGFYRCSIVANVTSTGVYIYPSEGDGVTSGTTGNIYIQDSQINYGLVAQEYQETTTTSVVSGITNDMPRLDYSGGASCPSLLLEPQRTNLVTSTEYLEYGWSLQNGATISFESVNAPDGSGLVTKIQANAGDASGRNQDSLGTLGTNHIWSGFFKGTGVATRLRFRNNQGEQVQYNIDASGNFTLHDADSANYGIEDFPNGWKRIWFETTTSGASTNYVQIYPDVENGTGSVYAWGIQAEEGSYVTSYIPNYGLVSGATRTADACSKTGISSLIGQTEGTIYIEVNTNQHISELSDDTSANRIVFYTDGSDYLRNLIRASSSTSSNIQTNTTIQAGDKIALAYANNDAVIYKNGVQIGSDTSVTIPATSKINVGSDFSENLSTTNSVNQALLFKTRLSNSDLATLTA